MAAFVNACAGQSTPFTGQVTSFDANGAYVDAVRLDWADTTAGEYGYEIQIADNDCTQPFRHAAYIGPGLTTYLVRGLKEASFYCFRMRAIRDGQFNNWTAPKLAITWTRNQIGRAHV